MRQTSNGVNKNYLLQLTKELYQLTLLFPKKEPLRYKMREVVDDILAKSAENSSPRVLEDLEVLDSFFEVAKEQNWVSSKDVLRVQEEYSKVKEELEKEEKKELILNQQEEQKILTVPQTLNQPGLMTEATLPEKNLRQQKILEFLKEKGRAQVWEVKKVFPQVSKRTLRRDFENLFNHGLVKRIGERNDTFYILVSQGKGIQEG